MMKKILMFVSIFLVVCPAVNAMSHEVRDGQVPMVMGTTLFVGGSGPGNHTTIQEAVNNASDGDTVYIYALSSPYYEHINVNKQLRVVGEDKDSTVIDGNGTGTVLSITSDLVEITQLTITNGLNGVHLDGRTSNTSIVKNIITNHDERGIDCDGFCTYITIKQNKITNNNNGTYMSAGSYFTIMGNSFENNQIGLVFNLWCNENRIHLNNFIDNDKDVYFFTSSLNRWNFNYWDRPRLLPKPIFGFLFFFPWVKFDWRPLITPVPLPD